jgi:tetratricopeptide (TPR) repeat protein
MTAMRLPLLLWVALLVSCGRSPDLQLASSFEEAGQKFLQAQTTEDYLRVAARYESILSADFVSGAVLFNLGNCYLRAGRPGHALAAYRQAERYRPTDPYLQANLRQALPAGQRLLRKPRSWIENVFFWQRWLSYPDKGLLLAATATVTTLLAMLALLRTAARRLLKRCAAFTLLLTLLAGSSLALDAYQYVATRHGVVVSEQIVARKGNSEIYDPAFTEPLVVGTEIHIEAEQGGWYHVELDGGLSGWVPQAAVVTY